MDWVTVAASGFAGFGLGVGLLLGAFVVRTLRRYMRDEHIPPYDHDAES